MHFKGEKTFRLPGAPIINDSLDIQLHPFQLFVPMPVLGKRIVGGYKKHEFKPRGGGGVGGGLGWEEMGFQKPEEQYIQVWSILTWRASGNQHLSVLTANPVNSH